MSETVYSDFHTPVNRATKTIKCMIFASVFRDTPFEVWSVAGAGYEFFGKSGDLQTHLCDSPGVAERLIKDMIFKDTYVPPEWQDLIVVRFDKVGSIRFSVERVHAYQREYAGWVYVPWGATKDPWTGAVLPDGPGTVGPMYAIYPYSEDFYRTLWDIRRCYNVLRDRVNAGISAKDPQASLSLFAERLRSWLVMMGYMTPSPEEVLEGE